MQFLASESSVFSWRHYDVAAVGVGLSHKLRESQYRMQNDKPGERGRAVDNDVLVVTADGVQLGFEARLAVVDGGGQLDVGVGV